MKVLSLLFLLSLPSSLQSTQPAKVLVVINRSGDDRVGNSTLYYLKEEIAKSSRYTTVYSEATKTMLDINIVTLDTDKVPAGNASAVSVVVVKSTLESKCTSMPSHFVMLVGSSMAEKMGKQILSEIDHDTGN